jgi:octaprenyl-diphosphate synthase
MVANDFVDDETQEFLGKIGVQLGIAGELAQAFDLLFFACGIGGGEFRLCLEFTDGLRDLESFGEHEHQRGVDIVNAVAVASQGVFVVHKAPSAAIAASGQEEKPHLHLPCCLRLARAGLL